MNKTARYVLAALMILCLIYSTSIATESKKDYSQFPEKGMITMIDLGAKKCIPCKMMAPILVKLEKAYEGKANIVFIDVRKHQDQAKRFGIRAIPTQIFFDKSGKEVFRHLGFYDEQSIVSQLTKMGVPAPDKDTTKG